LIECYYERKDAAGRWARRLQRERASPGVFLVEHEVKATNNRAELTLSLRQNCSQLDQATFGVLVNAVTIVF